MKVDIAVQTKLNLEARIVADLLFLVICTDIFLHKLFPIYC